MDWPPPRSCGADQPSAPSRLEALPANCRGPAFRMSIRWRSTTRARSRHAAWSSHPGTACSSPVRIRFPIPSLLRWHRDGRRQQCAQLRHHAASGLNDNSTIPLSRRLLELRQHREPDRHLHHHSHRTRHPRRPGGNQAPRPGCAVHRSTRISASRTMAPRCSSPPPAVRRRRSFALARILPSCG